MRFIVLIILSVSSQPIFISAVAATQKAGNALEKIVVTGTVPGPDMWRISNGENELWILGTLSPLPKKMDWNSKPIEQVIQSSQAFVSPPGFSFDLEDMGFFKKVSLITSAIGIKKNPDKQKLKDLLPADVYSRWLILKNQYMGKNRGIEKTRPIYASQKLFDKALKKVGLTRDTGILKKLKKVAKKNKLEMISPTVELELKEPKTIVKKLKKTEMNDTDCFSKKLDRIEFDLKEMSIRAKAWSYGDIKTIRSLPYADDSNACSSAIFNSSVAEELGMRDIRTRARNVWMKAVKLSLSNNKSTFAVLPMTYLINDQNIINEFESDGFIVELPSTIDEAIFSDEDVSFSEPNSIDQAQIID